MSDPAPPATPAGWYPEGVNGVRYWDGSAWTDHRAPAAPIVVQVPRKRTRNYLGDVSLAIAVFGLLAAFVIRIPEIANVSYLAAIVLSIVALSRAKARLTRGTAIAALSISVGILAVAYLVRLVQ